jgi:hypothetical protein
MKTSQYRIQLQKYCLRNNLPMTLDDEVTYHVLRDGITGGLSNVGHRVNYSGVTKINKLTYKDGHVYSIDTQNVMTHLTGCDFSSLYPSVCSSNPHPANPYTGHRMYMPGYQLQRLYKNNSTNEERMRVIMNPERFVCDDPAVISKLPYFVAVVKGGIPESFLNEFVNFPPVIRRLSVKTDEATIGSYMHSHMKDQKIPCDKTEKKLTQLLSTHDQYMSFGMYELWFLIDRCHFVIEEVESVITFAKHDRIGEFVNYCFNTRVAAKTKAEKQFWKIVLNSSYGADGMNHENFTKIRILDEKKTRRAQASSNFITTKKIVDDLFIVESEPTSCKCNKPLQTAYATLSNAKFWYLTFVYEFMYKCLDQTKFHFVYTDTDSYFWAVAGDPARGVEQNFEAIVSEGLTEPEGIPCQKFYEANFPLWFPEKKSILKLEWEHCAYDCIALAPKNYVLVMDPPHELDLFDEKDEEFKQKGVMTRGQLNNHLNFQAMQYCLNTGNIIGAENYVLRTKDQQMTQQILRKTGISGCCTKSVVVNNQACCPFVFGLTSVNYHVIE